MVALMLSEDSCMFSQPSCSMNTWGPGLCTLVVSLCFLPQPPAHTGILTLHEALMQVAGRTTGELVNRSGRRCCLLQKTLWN